MRMCTMCRRSHSGGENRWQCHKGSSQKQSDHDRFWKSGEREKSEVRKKVNCQGNIQAEVVVCVLQPQHCCGADKAGAIKHQVSTFPGQIRLNTQRLFPPKQAKSKVATAVNCKQPRIWPNKSRRKKSVSPRNGCIWQKQSETQKPRASRPCTN